MIEYYKNLSLESLFYINDDGLVCQEEWRDIKGYEKRYQVSDLGRVKSLSRQIFLYRGSFISKERILKQSQILGYLVIIPHKNDGVKNKYFKIHQLVAMEFLGHIPCGLLLVVDHKNNIKTDNRLCNLQIITTRKNTSKDRENKTGFTGVYKSGKYFLCKIKLKDKTFSLGTYKTKEEASKVYKTALYNIENNISIDNIRNDFYIKHNAYKGCEFFKGKYVVRLFINSKKYYLGRFNTEKEAISVYREAISLNESGKSFSHLIKTKTENPLKHIYKRGIRFRVIVVMNKKRVNVGTFDSVEEAISARDLAILNF